MSNLCASKRRRIKSARRFFLLSDKILILYIPNNLSRIIRTRIRNRIRILKIRIRILS